MQSFIASLSIPSKSVGAQSAVVKKFANSTQTGKNVAKVRWLQDGTTFTVCDSLATEYFVAGSYGESKCNEVSLWKLTVSGSRTGFKNAEVTCIDRQDILGDVAGMTALGQDRFAINNTGGLLTVFKCVENNYEQEEPHCITDVFFKQLHSTGKERSRCPATALVSKGNSIVSVGEDGSIFEISVATTQTLRSMEHVDPLSIYSAAITGVAEVVTGNSAGQLKVWDLRGSGSRPVHTMNSNVLLNSLYGAVSIAQHPSQSHCLLVGYQSGCLDLWDIRLGTGCEPVANLTSSSEGSLSEIYFHGINPDHFYSCSQSGELSHWSPADYVDDDTIMPDTLEHDNALNLEFLSRGITSEEVFSSSLPINSLNLSKNDRLLCGGDSGIVYCSEIKGI